MQVVDREQATTADQAKEIDRVVPRAEIEILFHLLKTGCRVESLQLASPFKIGRALALFMVMSWRIARLMRLGAYLPGFVGLVDV